MLTSFPVSLAVATALGTLSGLGIGGGSLLVLWLTLVLGIPTEDARVLNLMFFLPCAAAACLFRKAQGSLQPRKILPAAAAGCIAAAICSPLGQSMDTQLFKKLFGILMIAAGFRELTWCPQTENDQRFRNAR